MLAFAFGAKLHLPLVQAAGWARMTYNYAQLMPVADAFETAVSGRELCGACEYVRNAEHTKHATDALWAQSAVSEIIATLPDLSRNLVKFAGTTAPAWERPADCFAESRAGPRRLRPPTPKV